MCLFGGEIGWMENFGEKMGMKTFLVGVLLEGGEGKKFVGPRYFSLQTHQNVLSPKWGENLVGGIC